MEKLSISNISKNIFRTGQNSAPSKVEGNHTNPFGVSFKGNVLTADVFATSKNENKVSFTGNALVSKGKVAASAIVGSINKMKSFMNLNSIMSPIRRAGEKISNTWNKLNNITVGDALTSAKEALISRIPARVDSVNNIKKQEISAIREMFAEQLALI